MPVLLDTTILLRALQPMHPHCALAERAILSLRGRRETLWICAQNLMELWAVATRPVTDRGLGFSVLQTAQVLIAVRQHFPMLAETPLYGTWESLVTAHQVSGKNTHDARLVATMLLHSVDSILTFNTQDFKRYPQIKVIDPQTP
jgi:predicted nucleic acid-binding protein